MSRGLSESQQAILGLLRGDRDGRIYDALEEGCDTAELLEELIVRGLVNENAPRRQQMFTVVRACRSLERRGLVVGQRVIDADHPHCGTLHWTSVPL